MGRRVCGWCGKNMGQADVEGETTGICPACYKKQLAEVEKEQKRKDENEKRSN